jgi:UDP-GlcNAc:undecaprenyl-phosphate/decaprenyl-phosphate GlcNAc-1-phosphate transferase
MLGPASSALVAFLLAAGLVPLCRRVATRFGYIAQARDDRWHRRPTPYLGGVAIALTVLIVYPLVDGVGNLPVLLVGAGLMFGVGLVDDLINLRPYTKFVAAIVVASLFVFFGYRLDWSDWDTLDLLLTMIWIVGLTNAFNLLDNMDGLSAGVSLIAGAALLGALLIDGGATAQSTYLSVLLGATAGFLIYNVYPASIFMGDSGSLFIGLNLAVLTLESPHAGAGRTDVLSTLAGPLLLALVPILDTTLVTVSRILSGRSAAQGGRDHTSHRLVAIGLSERGAVAVLWALAALGGFLALSIRQLDATWPSLAAALFLLAMIIFTVHLANVRMYKDAAHLPLGAGRITPFVVDFMHKRRVAEVLLDLCLVVLAYQAAYGVRFEGSAFSGYRQQFLVSLPIVVGVQMLALFIVGAYRGVWRYFGLMDGVTFAKGVLLGTAGSVVILLYAYRFEHYSRGVFIVYAAILMLLLCGSRASFRLIREFAHRRRPAGQRLVIYGTGDGAATAVRDLLSTTGDGCRMLGFIHDDPAMARVKMQGYPVLGAYPALVDLVTNREVDSVVVTTPAIDVDRLEELQGLCGQHGVTLSRLQMALRRLAAS